jgi:hypothetical protein
LVLEDVLPPGHYRLRLTSGPVVGHSDAAGNLLDGDANATAGGAFVRTFFVAEPISADFDGSGEVDASDIDLLMQARNAGANEPQFDLTGDGLVNQADVDHLVEVVLGTHYGDANLDGAVNASDVAILASHFGAAGGQSWANGNANGDASVDLYDLALMLSNLGTGGSPSPAPPDANVATPHHNETGPVRRARRDSIPVAHQNRDEASTQEPVRQTLTAHRRRAAAVDAAIQDLRISVVERRARKCCESNAE